MRPFNTEPSKKWTSNSCQISMKDHLSLDPSFQGRRHSAVMTCTMYSSNSITSSESPINAYYKFTEIWSLYPWAYWISKIIGQPNISPGPLSAAVVISSEIGLAWGTIESSLTAAELNMREDLQLNFFLTQENIFKFIYFFPLMQYGI